MQITFIHQLRQSMHLSLAPNASAVDPDIEASAIAALGSHFDPALGLAGSIAQLVSKHDVLSSGARHAHPDGAPAHLIAANDGERWERETDQPNGDAREPASSADLPLHVSPTIETDELDELLCVWNAAMRKGTCSDLRAATHTIVARINLWRDLSVRAALTNFFATIDADKCESFLQPRAGAPKS
jgi:hypothetical protein